MVINHNDAPQGFVALQANPQHECKGCFFFIQTALPCPKRDGIVYFCEERKDGANVIFEKVQS